MLISENISLLGTKGQLELTTRTGG